MNNNNRIGGFVKNHGVSLVIAAATAGFAAHINSSVTNINNNVTQIEHNVRKMDDNVRNIDPKVLIAEIDSVIGTRLDSARNAIADLQDTLDAVTQNLRASARRHVERDSVLRDTLRLLQGKVDDVDSSLTSEAAKLQDSLISLDWTIHAQARRFAKKTNSLRHAVRRIRRQNEKLHSVRIYVGREKALRDCRYLKTSGFLCCKNTGLFNSPVQAPTRPSRTATPSKRARSPGSASGNPFSLAAKLLLCAASMASSARARTTR